VRHPTKLRPTKEDNFGLPHLDSADTDFIVGIARPSRVTLWTWERALDLVVADELVPNFPIDKNEQIYFDSYSEGIYDANPLILTGFGDTLASALRAKISQAISGENDKRTADKKLFSKVNVNSKLVESPEKNSYYLIIENEATGTTIRLGLLDRQSSPENPRLKPFNADFFKQPGQI